MLKNILAIAWQPRTYLRIVYLLLAFPLGMLYFVALLTLLSTGLGLVLVAGIGIGILLLAVACWYGFAGLERLLAAHLLGFRMAPMAAPGPPGASYRERLRRHLTNPVTWKSLGYLLLEFPFGVLTFTLIVILVPLCASFLLNPLAYLVSNYIYNEVPGMDGQLPGHNSFAGEIFPGMPINGHSYPNVFAFLCLFTIAGVPLLIGSLHLLNGLGYAWGRFAQLMLGVDESQVQLAAAESRATAERTRGDTADKSRRELVVNASHELRTPVASLRGHLDSLNKPNRKPPLDKEAREYVAIMAGEVRRLSALVDDVLSLARADAGELRLELRPIQTEKVAEQVYETLAPLARQEHSLQGIESSEESLPLVVGDPDRLAQVLTNLVRNAINYTPDGGPGPRHRPRPPQRGGRPDPSPAPPRRARREEGESRRRRSGGEAPLVRGPRQLDRGAHSAHLNGVRLSLTPKEFDLLALFAANPGHAFNREFLIERIWGGEFDGIDRAVDNHIRGLRKKLGNFGESIETVWGVGYRFLGCVELEVGAVDVGPDLGAVWARSP